MCFVHLEPIDGAWFELAVALPVPVFAVLSPNLRKMLEESKDNEREGGMNDGLP